MTNGHDEIEPIPGNGSSAEPSEEHDRTAEAVDFEEPPRLAFPVVGMGASAGGLEAFTDFFDAMRPDSGMAFVLIQHLPPDRESLMSEILSRHTKMVVSEVQDGIRVQANQVYIIRPGRTLTIKNGVLHLGELVAKPRHNRPVDDFFKSLAEEQRERAICVILSGMGSNGTAGAQSVKAVGGVCIAQDPDSAKFPSMPRTLIDAGLADFILRPHEMPETLERYANHPYTRARLAAESLLRGERQQFNEIIAVLRARTRQDFSGYKKPTVIRRIQRRMGSAQVTKLSDYAKIMRQNPTEVTALSDDLMIHVTGFFRDPEAWGVMQQQVIAPLIAERENDGAVRAWVTACSSGEEAYTLAMLLVEAAEAAGKHLDIKVFATDTAHRTLAHARSGIYPGGIEFEITPRRLERFFEKDDSSYRVKKELRELVVFAPQNLMQDPPFSRLDIVTCRNLLIYLEPDMQQRVLSLLHFGLRESGTLMLGTSETVAGHDDLFEPIDKKWRIFRRIGPTRHGSMDFPLPPHLTSTSSEGNGERDPGSEFRGPLRASIAHLTNKALLERYTPAAVTVDRQHRIVFFHGNSEPFLVQPAGEPTRDIVAMSREGVRGAVRLALHRAMTEATSVSAREAEIQTDQGRRQVTVTASPLERRNAPGYFLVSFEVRNEAEPIPPVSEDAGHMTPSVLADELDRIRQELQSAVEELQTSNEELKAANEEVTSVNEELQSTNEELETSKEEMQSLNEELTTVNSQLSSKMEELQNTSNDLSSLLSSSDIAVIFLDTHFRIRRFTPAVRDLVDLIPSDVGRPLSDMAFKFVDPTLMPNVRSVLEKLVPLEQEVTNDTGRWYMRKALPYRTGDNRIEGVVLTFVEITALKKAGDELRRGQERLQRVVENEVVGVAFFDASGLVTGSNDRFLQLTGHSRKEVNARGILLDRLSAADHAPEMTAALDSFQRSGSIAPTETQFVRPNGARWWGLFAGSSLLEAGDNEGVLYVVDVSDRKKGDEERALLLKSEQAARINSDEALRLKDDFLAVLSHELRTPLSAILIWAKMLRDRPATAAELKEGLDAIQIGAEAQKRLIDDLLDIARITAGKLRIEMVEADTRALIQSAVDYILPTADAKGVTLEVSLPDDLGLARMDPDRIQQVLWNLLSNAVKFTPAGGQVSVTASRADKGLTIHVSDTGEGIDEMFLPYVFDRFRQAESSPTRMHGGLGLGLAIAKQLVELHAGTISVQSGGIGKGTTFTVKLPVRKGGAKRSARPTGDHP